MFFALQKSNTILIFPLEEALDGYYVLLTHEMDEADDKVIDMYRGL